jgi:hypothetical protein
MGYHTPMTTSGCTRLRWRSRLGALVPGVCLRFGNGRSGAGKIIPSNTRMRFRKLRIAWSVGCLIACVLLIVLWMRSHWHEDTLTLRRTHTLTMVSLCGDVQLSQSGFACMFAPEVDTCLDVSSSEILPERIRQGTSFDFVRGPYEADLEIDFPHWCPVLVVAALTASPWVRWSERFSLRTLLIATTLVAVVLGLVVWATRQ